MAPRRGPMRDDPPPATSFGSWVRLRRRALGLRQADLARRVPCAAITIRKIELDERRPSQQMAECLADALELDAASVGRFLAAARTSFAPPLAPSGWPGAPSMRSVPAPTTPIIGRHEERGTALAMLGPAGGSARLLTITGPPGVGKTRLAIELAVEMEHKFEHPVYWVDLSGVAEPVAIPAAIARAVTPTALQGAAFEGLARRVLQRGPATVVIDNCEHLLAGVEHVAELLTSCPDLTIVATSRSALQLHGEHELALDPLAVVTSERAPGPAIALFMARASEVGSRALHPSDPVLRSIVERVGGFPLAIELAALRLREHDLGTLDASLASGFAVLGANRRGVPTRHSSLDAAVAWSESLLSPTELEVLDALAVFPSGADRDAVAAVAGHDPATAQAALDSLAGAALVTRTRRDGGGRCRFTPFVVVAEHVRARLAPAYLAAARCRHALVVLAAAEAGLPGISAWPEPSHMALLDDLDDDLHAALRCCFGDDGDPDVGIRLAVRAVSGWFFRGRHDACAQWAAAARRARPESYIALYLDAMVRWQRGDPDAAPTMEAAFGAAATAGDTIWAAETAGMAQTIALSRGDVALAADLGPRAIAWGEAAGGEWQALVHLRNGSLALRCGDPLAARHHSELCSRLYAAIGSTWGRATASVLAGSVAQAEHRYAAAAADYVAAIELFTVLGFPDHVAAAAAGCGHLLLETGRPEEATMLYGMVEAWLDELGIDLPPASRHEWRTARDQARTRLGEAYQAAIGSGASMLRDVETVSALLAHAGLMVAPITR